MDSDPELSWSTAPSPAVPLLTWAAAFVSFGLGFSASPLVRRGPGWVFCQKLAQGPVRSPVQDRCWREGVNDEAGAPAMPGDGAAHSPKSRTLCPLLPRPTAWGSAQTTQQLHTGFLGGFEKVHEIVSVRGLLGEPYSCPRDPEVPRVRRGMLLLSALLAEKLSGKEAKGNGRPQPGKEPEGRNNSERLRCGLTQAAVYFSSSRALWLTAWPCLRPLCS